MKDHIPGFSSWPWHSAQNANASARGWDILNVSSPVDSGSLLIGTDISRISHDAKSRTEVAHRLYLAVLAIQIVPADLRSEFVPHVFRAVLLEDIPNDNAFTEQLNNSGG